jgi:hypothetical protein
MTLKYLLLFNYQWGSNYKAMYTRAYKLVKKMTFSKVPKTTIKTSSCGVGIGFKPYC